MSSVVIAGNTSGTITLDAPAVAGTTTLTLPATSGTVLTNGTNTNFPAGSVLQVVSMTTTTGTNSTTTAYVDTAVTLSITPSSSSNKILVIYNLNGMYKSATSSSNSIGFNLVRGATSLGDFGLYFGSTGTALATVGSSGVGMYLDSPSTTSSTTYKVQIKNMTNASFVGINTSGDISSMTLMEIKG
jgi:pectate lyase